MKSKPKSKTITRTHVEIEHRLATDYSGNPRKSEWRNGMPDRTFETLREARDYTRRSTVIGATGARFVRVVVKKTRTVISLKSKKGS